MPNYSHRKAVVVLFHLQLEGDEGIHTFPNGSSPKANTKVKLEFKLTTILKSSTLANKDTLLQEFMKDKLFQINCMYLFNPSSSSRVNFYVK